MSEAGGPGITHPGLENERKIGAIGKPGLLWDARIVNEGVLCGTGKVGELLMLGPGVMKEYYKNPELTAATIKEDGLHGISGKDG